MILKRKKSEPELGDFQIQILLLLKYRSIHGYKLLQALKERGWQVASGTLYPTLQKLEAKGYIESFTSPPLRGQKERKNYRLTLKGMNYLQEIFNISFADAEFYIRSFQEFFQTKLVRYFGEDILILNLLNIIDPQLVFNALFQGKVPATVSFKNIYEFNLAVQESKMRLWPQILLFMPFSFTDRNYGISAVENYTELLANVRKSLLTQGRLWIVDFEWIKHALVDALTFLVTGELLQLAFTFSEIKALLLSARFMNVTKIGAENGIMIVLAEKEDDSERS
ncbi:MAG: PadR family transcriptional regulator [Candidatus Helarchaeota archaeon]